MYTLYHVIYKQISMSIVQVQRGLYENNRLIWIVIISVVNINYARDFIYNKNARSI